MNRNLTIAALVLNIALIGCAQKPNNPAPPLPPPAPTTGYDTNYHGPGSVGAIGNPPPTAPAMGNGLR